jgi:Xaa-Pro aminopeptidase
LRNPAVASERDTDRIERIESALRDAGLDALVCALPSNVLLLTGYWPVVGASVAIATRDGLVGLVVPRDEADLAAAGWPDMLELMTAPELDDLPPLVDVLSGALERVVRSLGVEHGRIGFERGPMLEPSSYAGTNRYIVSLLDLLSDSCPGARLVGADDLLLDLRAVLTPRELTRVRTACRVAEDAFRSGAASIVPGATERDVASAFRRTLAAYADAYGESTARAGGFVFCMSGPNAALADSAYARTRGRRIEIDDLVLVHCNSFVDGLWTDITRTYYTGSDGDGAFERYGAVLEARRAALDAIRPGLRASEIDRAAREVIERHGFGKQFRHGAGHGVGFAAIDHQARPRLHPASHDVLEPGMVFNLEPAIYLDHDSGIRHCDLVAVHRNGAELLTPFHDGLDDLAPRLSVPH